MIKISGNQVTVWKSSTFNYPLLSGTSSSSMVFNHNLGLPIDDYNLIYEESSDGFRRMHEMDRNGASFYGTRVSITTLNSVTMQFYRHFNSSGRPCHMKFIYYGE